MATTPKFEVIEENTSTTEDPERLLNRLLGIKSLSQRLIIALANCFSLLTVASVFWLALLIVPGDPSVPALVGLGGYAAFIIAVNVIVRRR